jgi:hypothetical protein
MVQNASAMKVDESKQNLGLRMQNSSNNDPDLNNRQKMRISFDPFDPGSNQREVETYSSIISSNYSSSK